MEEFKLSLLKLMSKYDHTDTLLWNEELEFFILCNDLFFWGTADGEEVESQDDVDLLAECMLIDDCYGPDIYAARKRKMRPQKPYYKGAPRHVVEEFNKCGPERDV